MALTDLYGISNLQWDLVPLDVVSAPVEGQLGTEHAQRREKLQTRERQKSTFCDPESCSQRTVKSETPPETSPPLL